MREPYRASGASGRDRGGGLAIGLLLMVLLGAALYGTFTYLHHRQGIQPSNLSLHSSTTQGSGTSNNPDGSGTVSGGSSADTTNSGGQSSSGLGSTQGTVTAISSTSITIQPSGGSPKTFAITSNTSVVNASAEQFGNSSAGQASASDIHVGETVVVSPDKSNPTAAIGILINP
jgi:hypothetical protein